MSYRTELPRVFELRDLIEDPEAPNSCFRDLERQLKDSIWMSKWRVIENELHGLDIEAWNDVLNDKQVKSYLTRWNPVFSATVTSSPREMNNQGQPVG